LFLLIIIFGFNKNNYNLQLLTATAVLRSSNVQNTPNSSGRLNWLRKTCTGCVLNYPSTFSTTFKISPLGIVDYPKANLSETHFQPPSIIHHIGIKISFLNVEVRMGNII
jgi:hypothetical protein